MILLPTKGVEISGSTTNFLETSLPFIYSLPYNLFLSGIFLFDLKTMLKIWFKNILNFIVFSFTQLHTHCHTAFLAWITQMHWIFSWKCKFFTFLLVEANDRSWDPEISEQYFSFWQHVIWITALQAPLGRNRSFTCKLKIASKWKTIVYIGAYVNFTMPLRLFAFLVLNCPQNLCRPLTLRGGVPFFFFFF